MMGLNPPDDSDFVSVYVDDVLVFMETLEEHLQHLWLVIDKFRGAGLKLKPSKCSFVQDRVTSASPNQPQEVAAVSGLGIVLLEIYSSLCQSGCSSTCTDQEVSSM